MKELQHTMRSGILVDRNSWSFDLHFGTAAANYLPAIVEASVEQIPMIVLTADRPQSFSKQAQIKASIKINCSGRMYAGFLIQAAPVPNSLQALFFHVSTRQFTLPVIRFLVLSI